MSELENRYHIKDGKTFKHGDKVSVKTRDGSIKPATVDLSKVETYATGQSCGFTSYGSSVVPKVRIECLGTTIKMKFDKVEILSGGVCV